MCSLVICSTSKRKVHKGNGRKDLSHAFRLVGQAKHEAAESLTNGDHMLDIFRKPFQYLQRFMQVRQYMLLLTTRHCDLRL